MTTLSHSLPETESAESGKSNFRVSKSVFPLSYLKESVGFVLQGAQCMVAQACHANTG